MPTPLRAIRIPDGLWQAAQAKAADQGSNVTAEVRRLLQTWIDETPKGDA